MLWLRCMPCQVCDVAVQPVKSGANNQKSSEVDREPRPLRNTPCMCRFYRHRKPLAVPQRRVSASHVLPSPLRRRVWRIVPLASHLTASLT